MLQTIASSSNVSAGGGLRRQQAELLHFQVKLAGGRVHASFRLARPAAKLRY